jgi:hypothetical protein
MNYIENYDKNLQTQPSVPYKTVSYVNDKFKRTSTLQSSNREYFPFNIVFTAIQTTFKLKSSTGTGTRVTISSTLKIYTSKYNVLTILNKPTAKYLLNEGSRSLIPSSTFHATKIVKSNISDESTSSFSNKTFLNFTNTIFIVNTNITNFTRLDPMNMKEKNLENTFSIILMIGLTASLIMIIIIIIGFIYLTKKTKKSSTVQITRTNLELQELNMPTAFANENVELRESNISSSKHFVSIELNE